MNFFENAKQIFIKNKRELINFQAGFKCKFNADVTKKYVLRLTGSTLYSVYLNNEFVFYGPARAAHGYLRFDELVLDVKDGENVLCIEVAGYNCASFYTYNIKSFLQAEVFENGNSVAYTGRDFTAISLDKLRERIVYRYSYQRAFSEVWMLDNSSKQTNWKTEDFEGEPVNSYNVEEEIIPRDMPAPEFKIDSSATKYQNGRFKFKGEIGDSNARFVTTLEGMAGYNPEVIKDKTANEVDGCYFADGLSALTENRYAYYSFDTINTGFIKADITAFEDSEIYFIFSEKTDSSGKIDIGIKSKENINVIKYSLKKSDKPYNLQSFEAYSLKYIGILVRKGNIKAENVSLCEYSYPIYENTDIKCSDIKLNEIFEAAKNTFRQNTVDCFMDCPGRERGGWLCDSYFTSQAEYLFTGKSDVEKQFLKNFVMAKDFPDLPEGMLPMCYPGSNLGFIPQWAMWYVLEVTEYLKRNNDDKMYFKETIYNLIEYFNKYLDKYCLLSNLDGWSFVEWSAANEYVSEFDISYPTNMLYSYMLKKVGEMYDGDKFTKLSKNIAEAVERYSFDGEHFVDGAVYDENGELVPLRLISEACQYYAMFCEIADINDDKYNKFYDLIFNFYNLERIKNRIKPEVEFSDLFIGLTLRFEALLKLRKYDLLLDNIKDVYYPMAKETGTLWEHSHNSNSLNHGFSSVAGVYAVKALCGIREINKPEKTVYLTREYARSYDYDITIGLDDGALYIVNKNENRTVNIKGEYKIKYTDFLNLKIAQIIDIMGFFDTGVIKDIP